MLMHATLSKKVIFPETSSALMSNLHEQDFAETFPLAEILPPGL